MSSRLIDISSIFKPARAVNKFYIHCTATDQGGKYYKGARLSNTIDRWHKERGFDGIGYHFVIDKAGLLATGRDTEKTPAAQYKHNTGTLAVCVHGLLKEKFTCKSLITLMGLCIHINHIYDKKITFHGHNEVSSYKTCPVFDYKAILDLDEEGNLGISASFRL